ncbi:hypothetical protein L6452_38394 [Arctium lappa]|uniref:Uncharacterized protein n=1 Tax=Arctium lappa TaxID=4217 RepID=A0ACB8Y5L5_ARCLA|nr:hypothetical protein L6452_38394 [Arctium lappa]
MGDQDLSQTLGDLLEIKGKHINNSSRNLLCQKVMTNIQAIKTRGQQYHHSNSAIMKMRRNPTRNNTVKIMKRRRLRRVGREGSRKATTMAIERKVRTLKKLIPKGESTVGLDGLFRETAEYISNLQMRVRIMQAVVDALSMSSSERDRSNIVHSSIDL